METLSLNQTFVAAPKQKVKQQPTSPPPFSFNRWLFSIGLLAIAVFCITQLTAAREFIAAIFQDIELLQSLLEDPNRWLN